MTPPPGARGGPDPATPAPGEAAAEASAPPASEPGERAAGEPGDGPAGASAPGGGASGAQAPLAAARPERSPWSLHLLDNDFPALHGGRVIGVVMVLQLHLSNLMMIHHRVPDNDGFYRSRQLWFVVDFFLALSGFLVSLQLLAALDRPEPLRSARRFYVRRIFRTFPLYYVSLALLWALPFATELQRADAPWEFAYLTNYKMLHRDPLMPWAWTLCVEEHFYAVAPLMLLALKRVRPVWAKVGLLSVLWLGAGLVRFATCVLFGYRWTIKERFLQLFVRTHTRLDIVLVGTILAVLFYHRREAFRAALGRTWVRCALGLVSLGAASLCFLRRAPIANRGLWDAFCWGTVTSVMMAAFLPLLIAGDGPLPRLFSAPWMRHVATLSYGMYLMHTPLCEHVVLPLLRPLRLPLPAAWTLGLVVLWLLSLGAAYALHLLVEKPVLAMRRRLAPSSGA